MNETKQLRGELDRIEPAAGAKERMLQNIRRKAAEQAGPERQASKTDSLSRTLRWALPLAACLTVAVVGAAILLPRAGRSAGTADSTALGEDLLAAGTLETEALPGGETETGTMTGGVMLPNPITEYGSAEELRAALGFGVEAPAEAEEVRYSAISGTIAQVSFTRSGKDYCLRAAEMTEDFSGLYGEEREPRLIDTETGAALTEILDGETVFRKLVWREGEVTYILSNTDGASEEEMEALYREIRQ